MESKALVRFMAIIFVAIAVTATAIEMGRDDVSGPSPAAQARSPASDPLRQGQHQCQQLGAAAANDPDCLAIWNETRDRFLGRHREPIEGH